MYAVIFIAERCTCDARYDAMAAELRAIAVEKYGCLDFVSITDGEREITISYWSDLRQIQRWKKDPLHRKAQHLGRTQWYSSYRVEVVHICRRYEVPLGASRS